MGLAVGVDYVLKDQEQIDHQGKDTYKSTRTKNKMMRDMVKHANYNMSFNYVLSDSWFSSAENRSCITEDCNSDFIMAIKSNRVVALSKDNKRKGHLSQY